MRRLVDEGSRDMVVREAVVRSIQAANVGSHDIRGQADAWFNAVKNGITFVNDPVRSEWLQSPRVTLNLRAGDCDDRSTLLAAGLAAIGIPSQFKVVALNRRYPGTFSHVYIEALINGRLVPMDATYPNNTLGTEPPRASRMVRYPAWRTA
jgi:transglutaminase-like putative cysteine protease